MNAAEYAVQGHLGVITLNNPPVNALAHGVRKGILGRHQEGEPTRRCRRSS